MRERKMKTQPSSSRTTPNVHQRRQQRQWCRVATAALVVVCFVQMLATTANAVDAVLVVPGVVRMKATASGTVSWFDANNWEVRSVLSAVHCFCLLCVVCTFYASVCCFTCHSWCRLRGDGQWHCQLVRCQQSGVIK
jgi:hypothetical protein